MEVNIKKTYVTEALHSFKPNVLQWKYSFGMVNYKLLGP